MAPCRECGVDEAAISVPDSTSAIRTFPRRFREALARIPADALDRRPEPDAPSAVEAAAHARNELELLAHALPRVLDEPGTSFDSLDVAPGRGAEPDAPVDVDLVVAGIANAADVLVARAEATPTEAWDRAFVVNGATHPASWILGHAAHAGSHDLREIDRVARLVGATDDD